jgi:murein DD-endopeptidase MepM/ murein hydrolase activator NlpD
MNSWVKLAIILLVVELFWWCPVAWASPVAVAPVLGDVVREFDPPEYRWLAGHRGVDIMAEVGTPVLAAMDGVVSFAGMVAGRPVISVNHGELTTTYEPVEPSVRVGDHVMAGQEIGQLIEGHSCEMTCLHWGVKKGEDYLDPLGFLSGGQIRLLTEQGFDIVRQRANELMLIGDGRRSTLGLISPTRGIVTSAYGMRHHPISGKWKFHDGIDIAHGCGTPLVASASGRVVESHYHGGYGNRLVIDHGVLGAVRVKTGYNHAQRYSVRVGEQVFQGQVVGWMGTTGYSTGCHLHFQVWVNGSLVNPRSVLP